MAYSLRLILRHHDPLGYIYIYIYIYIRTLITSWLLLPGRRHGGNAAASAAAAAVALRLGVAGFFFRLAGKSWYQNQKHRNGKLQNVPSKSATQG